MTFEGVHTIAHGKFKVFAHLLLERPPNLLFGQMIIFLVLGCPTCEIIYSKGQG